jgi:hypothetical protein
MFFQIRSGGWRWNFIVAEEKLMAHVYDTKAQIPAAAGSGVTALTCIASITCGGSVTLLVLALQTATTTARTGNAPLYNSVTMTDSGLGSISSGGEGRTELWYLSDPSKGAAYDVEVPNDGRINMRLIVSSYAAQSGYTSVLDVATSLASSALANPGVSLLTTINGDVIIGTLFDGYASTPTAISHTLLYNNDDGAYNRNAQYFLQATAGATTLSWTITSDDVAIIVAAFKESLIGAAANATMIIKQYHWGE